MNSEDTLFSSVWRERQNAKPEPPSIYCEPAQDFEAWAVGMTRDALQKRDLVSINQAKVLLIDRFYEWRAATPKRHRNRQGKISHPCIFDVFEDTYWKLRLLELSLTPPMLFLPPPPSEPATTVYHITKIEGFPIGEGVSIEDDE
jgi:hypothetical protein